MVYSQGPVAEKERQRAGQASPLRSARDQLDERFDQRAGQRSRTASIHSIHSFGRKGDQFASERPPLGRRIFRTLSRFVFAVLIGVSATLAWQSYGDVAREMVAARAPALGWLVLPTKRPILAASNTAQQSGFSLDALRRSVELLAARQEQMAQNIAALQAIEEDIRQKMSFTPASLPGALTQPPAPTMQQKPAARAPVSLAR